MVGTGYRMSLQMQDEALWIHRVAAGDREAFEKLYSVYQRRLFSFLYRLVNEAGAVEELVNDVMVEVWKSASRFRGDAKASTWIFAIAHHVMLNHLRRRKRDSVDLEKAQNVAAPGQNPEVSAIHKGLQGEIHSALGRLSAEHREIVELTFYEGYSYEEISAIVQCPVNTVKTRMFHAKKKLRDTLARMGRDRL
jgi:RNA polymerase sigma-70 factor (ECF subfamily)